MKILGLYLTLIFTLLFGATPNAYALEAPVFNGNLSISVWAPLVALFENQEIKLGQTPSGEIFFPTSEKYSYSTGGNEGPGFGISPVIVGEQKLTLYPNKYGEYLNRLIHVDISLADNSNILRRITGDVLMEPKPVVLSLLVGKDGSLVLSGRPGKPTALRVSFTSDQKNTILSWQKPSTGTAVASYRVYQREVGRYAFQLFKEVPSTVFSVTYPAPALPKGSLSIAYEFIVLAVDASGQASLATDVESNYANAYPSDLDFGIGPVATGEFAVWKPKLVAGINVPVVVSISNAEYSIDGGAFRSDAQYIEAGQTLAVRIRRPTSGKPPEAALYFDGVQVSTFWADFQDKAADEVTKPETITEGDDSSSSAQKMQELEREPQATESISENVSIEKKSIFARIWSFLVSLF